MGWDRRLQTVLEGQRGGQTVAFFINSDSVLALDVKLLGH